VGTTPDGVPKTRRHQCFYDECLEAGVLQAFLAASALFWSLNGPTCTRKYLSCAAAAHTREMFFLQAACQGLARLCLARAATCKTSLPLEISGAFAAFRSTGVRVQQRQRRRISGIYCWIAAEWATSLGLAQMRGSFEDLSLS